MEEMCLDVLLLDLSGYSIRFLWHTKEKRLKKLHDVKKKGQNLRDKTCTTCAAVITGQYASKLHGMLAVGFFERLQSLLYVPWEPILISKSFTVSCCFSEH